MHLRGTFEIVTVAAMHDLAAQVAVQLAPGDVLLLTGPLGSGKTTFVQGLAQSLGVGQAVTSPTFTVAAEYPVTGHQEIERLVHLDLYRLPDQNASGDPAVASMLEERGQSGRVTVVEWAERLDRQPATAWRILFMHGATRDARVVRIE